MLNIVVICIALTINIPLIIVFIYLFLLNKNRNLEVMHTSPMKTYGKRKKQAVFFSDSSDEENVNEK